MPRPKAPKLVKTAPNLDYLKNATSKATFPNQREASPASSGRVTNGTDDSDGLVVSKRGGGRKPNATSTEAEYSMSGALVEETGSTRLKPPSKRIAEEVTRIAREADYAMVAEEQRKSRALERKRSKDDNIPPSVPLQNLSGAHVGSQRRPSALLGSRRPSFASRVHQTPLGQPARPESMLFKKRVRQPSLLQMVNVAATQDVSEDESGDLDDDDFRPDDESTPLIKSLSQSNVHQILSSSQQTSGSRKRKLKSPEIQVPVSQSSNPAGLLVQSSSQVLDPEDVSDPEIESNNEEPVLPRREAHPSPERQVFSDTMAPPESSSSPSPEDSHRYTNTGPPPSSNKDTGVSRLRSNPRQRSNQSSKPTTTPLNRKTRNAPKPKPLTTATLQNLLPRRRNQAKLLKSTYDFPSTSELESNPGSDDAENLHDDKDDDDEADELSFSASRRPTKRRRPRNTSTAIKAKTPLQQQSPLTRPGMTKRNANTTARKPSHAKSSSTAAAALTIHSPSKITPNDKSKPKAKAKIKNKPQDKNDVNNNNNNRRISHTYSRKPAPAAATDTDTDTDTEDDDHQGGPPPPPPPGGAGTAITLDGKAQAEMARLARKFREVDDYTLDFEDVTAGSSGGSQMKDAR